MLRGGIFMRCKDPISHRQWGAPVATESKHQHAVKPAMSTCCALVPSPKCGGGTVHAPSSNQCGHSMHGFRWRILTGEVPEVATLRHTRSDCNSGWRRSSALEDGIAHIT